MEPIPTGALLEKALFKKELSFEEQSHLESCDSCRKQLGWMQIASAGADLEDPPQSVMDKVIQVGRNRDRLKQLRTVISALLTFDSFKLAPVGVRSQPPSSRQKTFEVDGIEIGIWLRPSSDQKMMLSGQVLGKSSGPIQDTSAYVDLVIEGDHVHQRIRFRAYCGNDMGCCAWRLQQLQIYLQQWWVKRIGRKQDMKHSVGKYSHAATKRKLFIDILVLTNLQIV